jgi:hypothetical protein
VADAIMFERPFVSNPPHSMTEITDPHAEWLAEYRRRCAALAADDSLPDEFVDATNQIWLDILSTPAATPAGARVQLEVLLEDHFVHAANDYSFAALESVVKVLRGLN